jgi:hypothetical protein
LSGKERGVLPRALESIITELKRKPRASYKLSLSFLEVYNEKIYDLFNSKLANQPNGLEVREKLGDVQIPGSLNKLMIELFSVDI